MTASRSRLVSLLLLTAFSLFICTFSRAQQAEKLSDIKKLFVDSLGSDASAIEARNKLIHRLEKSHRIQIVDNRNQADAVLKGTAHVWAVGQISLSPHSRGAVASVLEGYLSTEIIGKQNQALWSYLVTPSRFPWGGVVDDLSKQMASRLISAVETRSEEVAVSNNQPGTSSLLKGAGATFPAPLYEKWFEDYHDIHPAVRIRYDPVGSADGIRQLDQGSVDFAASEMPLTAENALQANHRIKQVPVVLGAVVPIYNLKSVRHPMNFTPEILAGIYLGKIKKWNDPEIRKVNSGSSLPDATIVVTHRSDGSGTTFVWSDFLSKVSPQWRAEVGTGVTVRWPLGQGEERNEGVASAVHRVPNSIGYVELIYAIQHELSFGTVRNAAGQFIKADLSSVTAASRAFSPSGPDLGISLTNSPGATAYPIATYTWLLIPDQIDDKEKKSALLDLLRWMLTYGQKSCAALGYAPLPPDVARRALQSIDNL